MTRASIVTHLLAVAFAWLAGSCCHHSSQPRTVESVPVTPAGAPVLRPIEYTRTGGIMGTEDHIEVTTGGEVHVRGRMFGRREGRLNAEQQGELARAFTGWNDLADDYPGRGADAFQYQIQFDRKKVSASQTSDAPEPFTRAREQLEAIAQSLPQDK
jgi:hypothetical protein